MCGIVGFQGDFSPELLGPMCDSVAHRGPDAAGQIFLPSDQGRGSVGLGHRRLAIIDLSDEGCQPMQAACEQCGGSGRDGLHLSYNGEIYNFRELRRELVDRGHCFHSETDSEVLLHLYAEHGLAMLSRLNGIFAFALYDGRRSGRPDGVRQGDLLLARDQLGVKPLYHANLAGGICFASELKALLQVPGLPRELNPAAVHYHLAYLWSPAPETVLRSVKKLRPGTAMLLRSGRVAREWTYYRLPYGVAPLSGSEADIAVELRERLERAVSRQMVSDVPVGAFLSGGLDSSAVVAMMKRVQPGSRPICYSIGFAGEDAIDGAPADLPYARRVADHLDVRLHSIETTPAMIGDLGRMLFHLDEPQADPAPIHALLIAEQARKDGVKVLLSGAGGDDIMSGYRRHRALVLEPLWSWLPRRVKVAIAAGAQAAGEKKFFGRTSSSAGRRAVKLFSYADLEGDRRLVSYFWWSNEILRRSLYTPEFASELGPIDTAAPLLESLELIPAERNRLNRMLYLETRHFLADHNLNYTDKMGMAAGVEVRVPLVDLELVEFAARIPPRMKQKGAEGKAIFKKAMEPLLPHDVIYRPKTGFGAPLRAWLQNELRQQVDHYLSAPVLERRGIFDPRAARSLVERDRAGRVDGSYTIFAMMCLEMWCQMFIDPPVAGEWS